MAILKLVGLPGSNSFFLLVSVLALFMLRVWPRQRAIARACLASVLALYLVLALPWVANTIADRLTDYPADAPIVGEVHTLIVLDGDNRRGRAAVARQIIDTRHPACVVVLGDKWILEALTEEDVSADRFDLNGEAGNTRAQIAQVARLAAHEGNSETAVIASRLQMPRVAALVRRRGIKVRLIASPIDDEPPTSGIRQFLPTYIGLRTSRDAIYELAALIYYRWRGWIGTS